MRPRPRFASANLRLLEILGARLARIGLQVGVHDLADKLAAVGIKDNERNISNKNGCRSFTAVLFIQCLVATGCTTIHLDSRCESRRTFHVTRDTTSRNSRLERTPPRLYI
jgi:Domain of unknown function (DUF6471)